VFVQISGTGLRDGSKSLAKLQFLTVIFTADMKSDRSMAAAVSLKTCHLSDSRPARQSGITRYVKGGIERLMVE